MRRALILAAILAGCGPTLPQLHRHRDGFHLEAYGFRCECGETLLLELGRPTVGVYRVRCERCRREWFIREPS